MNLRHFFKTSVAAVALAFTTPLSLIGGNPAVERYKRIKIVYAKPGEDTTGMSCLAPDNYAIEFGRTLREAHDFFKEGHPNMYGFIIEYRYRDAGPGFEWVKQGALRYYRIEYEWCIRPPHA